MMIIITLIQFLGYLLLIFVYNVSDSSIISLIYFAEKCKDQTRKFVLLVGIRALRADEN